MQGEFKVSRCTRRCHSLDRPLGEGEWYYSVLVELGDGYQRQDYSAQAWSGPPKEAIGWWKNRMPTNDEKKLVLAPKEVLIDLLHQMADHPERAKSRYLLALMLLRRRLLKQTSDAGNDTGTDTGDGPGSVLNLEVIADGSRIAVPVCEISRAESADLRDQLNELIYCESED